MIQARVQRVTGPAGADSSPPPPGRQRGVTSPRPPLTPCPPRLPWARWLAALLLSGLLPAGAAHADNGLALRLQAARQQVSADPRAALRELQALRQDATAVGDLVARLQADEIECRVLADLDQPQATRVADAGLAAAGESPPAAAVPAWLRLRSCRAGTLLDLGQAERGHAELDAVLARATAPTEADARGMALLERGVNRSRRGDLVQGQTDLLAACQLLKTAGTQEDQDLCSLHLSSHYRRTGDADEALMLLAGLHERAQRSGALYDDSIYVYAIASTLQTQGRWQQALEHFQQSITLGERFQDKAGIAYAEHGVARSLLEMKLPRDAMVHARRSIDGADASADPRDMMLRTITLAEALVATDQPAEARRLLDGVAASLRAADYAPTLVKWLEVRAQALGRLAQWKDAHDNLVEARAVDQRLHAQQLSEQSARLRMQFNRARDQEELDALRRLNEQGQRLRQTQAVALVLFVLLLGAALVQVARKVRQAQHLNSLALTDELTALPNRRALFAYGHDAFAQARRSGGALSVLMVDVDHFKRINDGHGHGVGDQVLRHLSQVLGGQLRVHDRLGRVGGEEFVVVLPGAAADDARQVAERMRQAVHASPAADTAAGPVAFSVSIGVATSTADASLDDLLARADRALYRAKSEGRDRVCVAA